jgi:hypothetical protein
MLFEDVPDGATIAVDVEGDGLSVRLKPDATSTSG